MEVKSNDATRNRPEGDRLIDAPAVFIDVSGRIEQLLNEDAWKKNDRNGISVFKSPEVIVVLTALHEHARLDDLNVQGMVLLRVEQGSVHYLADKAEQVLREKQMVVMHAGLNPVITAVEDCVLMLTIVNS